MKGSDSCSKPQLKCMMAVITRQYPLRDILDSLYMKHTDVDFRFQSLVGSEGMQL